MVTHRDGGRFLAELRQQAGLTQTELAERAGISRSMVAQIEIGERRPSRKMLRALGQGANASSEEEDRLFAAYDFIPSGQTPEQIAALLRADKQLTAEQAERIAALVREAYEREMNG